MTRDSFIALKNPLALRYFYEAAKAGSFRRAGEQTHIAASAINRHVKHLEDEVGTLLFERGRGRSGLRLTAVGEIYFHRIKRAINELGTARSEADALIGLKRGTVNFGVNEGIWRELLPQLLVGFRAAHPGVDFRITAGSSQRLIEQLLEDEIDFALAFNPQVHHGVHVLIKRSVDPCVMVKRDHPLAARRSVRLSDCAKYDLVMPDSSLALRATLDQMFAQAGVVPRAVLTTNSYEIMRTAAHAGVGIAILTQHVFNKKSPVPGTVYVPIREPGIGPQVLACCARRSRILSGAANALIAAIDEAMQPAKASR